MNTHAHRAHAVILAYIWARGRGFLFLFTPGVWLSRIFSRPFLGLFDWICAGWAPAPMAFSSNVVLRAAGCVLDDGGERVNEGAAGQLRRVIPRSVARGNVRIFTLFRESDIFMCIYIYIGVRVFLVNHSVRVSLLSSKRGRVFFFYLMYGLPACRMKIKDLWDSLESSFSTWIFE